MSIKPFPAVRNNAWTLVAEFEDGAARYVLLKATQEAERLSGRERQILARAALGQTNKVIAYEIGLSYSTVRVHIFRACAKLGVRTRRDAIEAFRALDR